MRPALGELEHAIVEGHPGELTVEEQLRGIERDLLGLARILRRHRRVLTEHERASGLRGREPRHLMGVAGALAGGMLLLVVVDRVDDALFGGVAHGQNLATTPRGRKRPGVP